MIKCVKKALNSNNQDKHCVWLHYIAYGDSTLKIFNPEIILSRAGHRLENGQEKKNIDYMTILYKLDIHCD